MRLHLLCKPDHGLSDNDWFSSEIQLYFKQSKAPHWKTQMDLLTAEVTKTLRATAVYILISSFNRGMNGKKWNNLNEAQELEIKCNYYDLFT